MPGGFVTLDVGPMNLQHGSTEQKVQEIADYINRLQEQLRYVLYNLGVENLNPESLKELGEIINAPVQKEIAALQYGYGTTLPATGTPGQVFYTTSGTGSGWEQATPYLYIET